MECRDAIVVGAGPAGSSCAWRLRQAGLDVLVLDRRQFPRDKTCAGWITPAVVDALQVPIEEYRQNRVLEPIVGFRVGVIDGRATDVLYDRAVSYAVRRSEFDQFLIQRSGAEFRPGTSVDSIRRDRHRWILNEQVEAPVIIGAGGHFCPVARAINPHAGVEAVVLTEEAEVRVDGASRSLVRSAVPEFYFTPDFKGYGWVVRKGQQATVGIGRQDSQGLRRHLESFLRFLFAERSVPDLGSARWRGHAYLLRGSSRRRAVADGAVLVGDAAGVAHPRSGEGIHPAVVSGLTAAETILDAAGTYDAKHLGVYGSRLDERLGRPRPSRRTASMVPKSLQHAIGRYLVGLPWCARHVVVERWFLRTGSRFVLHDLAAPPGAR